MKKIFTFCLMAYDVLIKKILFFFKCYPKYKILYLSSHTILEYDELKILRNLGHFVFSPGAGRRSLRPMPSFSRYEKKLFAEFDLLDKTNLHKENLPMRLFMLKSKLTKKFLNNFDLVIVMHYPQWIIDNWSLLKNKKVIWRSIGQSSPDIEESLKKYRLQGLKVIRYSPLEANLLNYIGHDEIIRFYKSSNEFDGWNGSLKKVMTISQEMKLRSDVCHYDAYKKITFGVPSMLYGYGNKKNKKVAGEIKYDDLKKHLKRYRCFLYMGTYPASYTLAFIEAWMTGIPIIAIGNKIMNDKFPDQQLYEVPSLIQNGKNGFCIDNISELKKIIKMLIDNKELAKSISKEGRKSAIKIFGEQNARKKWLSSLYNIMEN